MKTTSKKSGYVIIEVLLAMAIFVSSGTAITYLLIDAGASNLRAKDRVLASTFAEAGLEAAKNIRDSGWDNLTPNNHGLVLQDGAWAFLGESDSDLSGRFSRQVNVTAISADRMLVTSSVRWTSASLMPMSVSFSTYLNNWRKTIVLQASWNTPKIIGSGNTGVASGNRNPFGLFVLGNYAYLVTDRPSSTDSEFFIFDITNPATPTLVGKTLTGKRVYSVFVAGDYAYLTSQVRTSNRPEMIVIKVTDPAHPAIVARVSLTGSAYAKDVTVIGNYAYLTTLANSTGPEFFVIDITNPESPVTTPVGTLEFAANLNAINIAGNYACVATSDDAKEIQIINITNPATPSVVKSFDNPGLADATDILFSDNKIYFSALINSDINPNFAILTVDASNPANIVITPVGQTQLTGDINGLALDVAGNQVFLATSLATQEFVSLDITDQTHPIIKTSVDLPATAVAITFNGSYVFIADNTVGQQLIIIGSG